MKVHDVDQTSDAWFRLRAGRPTASMFKRIVNPDGSETSDWTTVVFDLITECYLPNEQTFEGNVHTRRGLELEPVARQWFADRMGVEIEEPGFVTADHTICGASPDGLLPDHQAGLEIKCPVGRKHLKTVYENKLPDEYVAQIHGSMWVTQIPFWYFLSYCPGMPSEGYCYIVESSELTEKVGKALKRFEKFYAEKRNAVLNNLKERGIG